MKTSDRAGIARRFAYTSPVLLALLASPWGCSSDEGAEATSASDDNTTTGPSTTSAGSTATGSGTNSSTSATNAGPSTTSAVGTASSTTGGRPTTTTGAGSTGQGTTSAGTTTSTGVGGGSSETSTGPSGAGGTNSASTTTGGGVAVQPSAGCSSGNASPSLSLPANTLFSFPSNYDGSTPVPVVIAFHAAGNPNTQIKDRLGDDLEDKYLMLYPKSDGNEWTQGDLPKVDAMFDTLKNDACIDENRVFSTGHSSGAQFIVQLLCDGETRFRAISPMASSKYCDSWQAVPALVIHGIGDQERSFDPNGEEDIVPYRSSNSCETTSTEYPVDGCQSGSTQVDPGCVEFAGCDAQTIWCQHNDPQYGMSHHGMPCFADTLIPAFFDSF